MENLVVLLLLLVSITLGQAQSEDQLRPILHQTLGLGVDGQYQYKYNSDIDSKHEMKDEKGQTLGGYSYVDENGVLQKVEYVAGPNGFQVSGTNLPTDTPEVALAKQQHQAAIDQARSILPPLPPEPEQPEESQLSRSELLEHILSEVARARAAYDTALRLQEEAMLRDFEPTIQLSSEREQDSQPKFPHLEVEAKPQVAEEQASTDGFRKTPEVALARQDYFAALAAAKNSHSGDPELSK